MASDAKGLVLMKKESGILTQELGSYEINGGLELVYKAFVEEGKVKLYLTTDKDVTDEEYNEVFDEYEEETLVNEGFSLEEVEDEYNPVWCVTFDYKEEFEDMEEDLNFIITYHKNQIEKIFENIKS
jgi:hypothetical protein